jgi:hypothetical protein
VENGVLRGVRFGGGLVVVRPATIMCIIGFLEIIFIGMLSVPV